MWSVDDAFSGFRGLRGRQVFCAVAVDAERGALFRGYGEEGVGCKGDEEGGVEEQRVFFCGEARDTESGGERKQRVIVPVCVVEKRWRGDDGAEVVPG